MFYERFTAQFRAEQLKAEMLQDLCQAQNLTAQWTNDRKTKRINSAVGAALLQLKRLSEQASGRLSTINVFAPGKWI